MHEQHSSSPQLLLVSDQPWRGYYFFFSTGHGTVIFWSRGVDLIQWVCGAGYLRTRGLASPLHTQLVGSAKEERDRRSSSLRWWCGCPPSSTEILLQFLEIWWDSCPDPTLLLRFFFSFLMNPPPDHASWGSWFHSAASLFLGFVLLQAVVSSSSFSEEDADFRSGSFVVWIW